MFGHRWRLFRLFGIPIGVDVSWLFIFVLLTFSLVHMLPQVEGFPPAAYIGVSILTALAFFSCIILHELGHALVARQTGIPIRGITLFLFGGVAEMEEEPPSAMSEFLMAIAGPLVSIALAVLFWSVALVGVLYGWTELAVKPLAYLGWINLILVAFNMVPAFPLDGGRVLRSILWAITKNLRKATYWASLSGQAFAWLLIGVGIIHLFNPEMVIVGIWMGLIGLFLNNAARASYQQVLIRQALEGEPVRRFMNTKAIVVPPYIDLQTWIDDYVYRYHRKTYPVASNGRLEGIISARDLAQIPRSDWSNHTVAEVMRHDVAGLTISQETDALHALQRMRRTGSSRLVVTDHDQIVGIVSLKDLLRFLDLKLELDANGQDASTAELDEEMAVGHGTHRDR